MFAEVLKRLRKNGEMTQSELAEKLKISRSTINMYERGERHPDPDTLMAFATFFGCTVDYLLGFKNNLPEGYVEVILSAKSKDISPAKLKRLMDFLDTVD